MELTGITAEEIKGVAGTVDEGAVRRKYEALTRTLIEKHLTITTMESCTAGQVASLITDTEGSSAIMKGAFVTYSNEAKIRMGVPEEVIDKYGVYSVQTAASMAKASRGTYDADIAVGVTGSFGNADPNNADSVPGEVFFALETAEGVRCFHCTVPAQPSRLAYKLYMADVIADRLFELIGRSGISILLWDVDGTLLDFKAAERRALQSLFEEFSLGPCSEEMVRRYSQINDGYWQRLERNEITKPQVLVGRFEEFFREIGVPEELAPEFNQRYQLRLGDTIVYRDDSYELVKSLRGKVRQYVVSNGTVAAQSKKLRLSGFGELMDGVFLSEKIGAEKPNRAFFDAVFEAIRPASLSEVMIVGDSLTSDIKGGINAGIITCWYDPDRKPVPPGYPIDHVIADLHEVVSLLDGKGIRS